jgi:hypothetical protein
MHTILARGREEWRKGANPAGKKLSIVIDRELAAYRAAR